MTGGGAPLRPAVHRGQPDGRQDRDYREQLNPESLEVLAGALLEPSLAAAAGGCFQFERLGYFCADPQSTPERPVFNRTVTLRDSWAKVTADS